MRFFCAAVLCGASVVGAQSGAMGSIEVYRYGGTGVALPIAVDGQVKAKLGNHRKLVLPLTPGEHQVTCDVGNIHAAAVVRVAAGTPTFLALDYEHASFGAFMVMRDKTQAFTATLEHVNAPPDGEFKPEEVKPELLAQFAALPPMHEEAAQTQAPVLQMLSEDEVREALLQGSHTAMPTTIGLLLDDAQRRFGSALQEGQSVSGFSVRVYTAKQWLALLAARASREMRPFPIGVVRRAMREKRLYVLATPSTPDRLTGQNMAAASNVQRIVLELGASRAVVQPFDEEATSVRLNSALRSADFDGVSASFPQPDITQPFYIVVIGDNDKKEFQVKDKHLARLR